MRACLVSVIIPNLNSNIIDRTIAALHAQIFDMDQVEVIIVGLDQQGLIQQDQLVRFLPTAQPTPPAIARNIGIQASKGKLLCFTDADCIPNPNWLLLITKPFLDTSTRVVGGGVSFETNDYWTLCDNVSWFHDFLTSKSDGERALLPSLNLCVSREIIQDIGLFDESYPYPAGEDSEWTTRMRRAGYRLIFSPSATVFHHPNRSRFKDIWMHGERYGRYSIKIHPDYQTFLQTPFYLQHSWAIILLAPIMSAYITLRIFGLDSNMREFWYTIPGVYISKLAWCIGAARALRNRKS